MRTARIRIQIKRAELHSTVLLQSIGQVPRVLADVQSISFFVRSDFESTVFGVVVVAEDIPGVNTHHTVGLPSEHMDILVSEPVLMFGIAKSMAVLLPRPVEIFAACRPFLDYGPADRI